MQDMSQTDLALQTLSLLYNCTAIQQLPPTTKNLSVHTGGAVEGHCGHVPLGAYSVTQNSAKNAPKRVILTPKIQKFSPEPPPQTLFPLEG